ncbi:MAG: purine-nucleoside phosphorylase [Pleomorphochaeta sp.]
MDNLLKKLDDATSYISQKIGDKKIDIAMVLGSGLGDLANEVENPTFIPYSEIPSFPKSTVAGHAGRLVIGELEGKTVLCMQGRFHYYEGYNMDIVVFPIQVMKRLNISNLLLTNAAGCTNKDWTPGDLMIIKDHIKLIADNPLRGANYEELGPRFFDMSNAYDKDLRIFAKNIAEELNIEVREGVYQLFTGPSYETQTEVKLAKMLGADAVGMSTVPEAISAAHMGMKTLGISCLTNMAAGILDQPLNHEEVLETSLKVKTKFTSLVKEIVKQW